jgi:EpsI family protein
MNRVGPMNRRTALLLALFAIFAVQAVSFRFLRREPFLPSPPPLSSLPLRLGDWERVAEETVPPETLDVLGPDDYLSRLYRIPGETGQAEIFVAYYKSQLSAKQAHDPKVCLPGSGWNPVESRLAHVTMPGSGFSFPVNYYRIKRDENVEVVVYWFQTLKGVYTFEQQLKAHRVLDAILDNRTDMALVRIVVPVAENSPSEQAVANADKSAMRLAQSVYASMLPYFPPTEKTGS